MLGAFTGCVSKQSVSNYTPNIFSSQEKDEPASGTDNEANRAVWRIVLKAIAVDEMQQLFGMLPNQGVADIADLMVLYTAEKAHFYLGNQKESLRYQALRKKLIAASDSKDIEDEPADEARGMVKKAMADISALMQDETQAKSLTRKNLLEFSDHLFTLAIVEREIFNRIQSPLNSVVGNITTLESIPGSVLSYTRLVGHTKDTATLLLPALEVVIALLELDHNQPYKPDVETILSKARKL